jgi:hypothetical protein
MEKREGNVFRSLHLFLSAANVTNNGYMFQISIAVPLNKFPLSLCKMTVHFIVVHLTLLPIMRFIFYIVLFYLLYKLVFDFILPVTKATSQIKKNIRNAQAQQQQFYEQQQNQQSTPPQQEQKSPAADTEYIDFEEVK